MLVKHQALFDVHFIHEEAGIEMVSRTTLALHNKSNRKVMVKGDVYCKPISPENPFVDGTMSVYTVMAGNLSTPMFLSVS